MSTNKKFPLTAGSMLLGLLMSHATHAVVQCEQPGNASGINIVEPPADLPVRLEQQVLLPDEYVEFMDFGFDTAMSGSWLAISAGQSPSTNQGFVDLYQFNNGDWNKVKTWEGPERSVGDVFDSTALRTALENDLLVIGNLGALNNTGSAHVYGKDTGGADNWGLLTNLDGSVDEGRFGSSVEIQNQTLAITSGEGLTPSDFPKGAIYLFEPDEQVPGTWVQSAKPDVLSGYSAETRLNGFQFSGDYLIGSTREGFNDSRQAFIWEHDGDSWVFSQDLVFPDTCNLRAVAVDGDTAVVNLLPADGTSQTDDSALLFYERDEAGTWQLQFELDTSVYVGDMVLQGDRLVAGAIDLDAVAYVFERQAGGSEWQFAEKLMSSDSLESPHSSVSISGNRVAIRASRFVPEDVEFRTGAVLTYSLQDFAINPGLNDAWVFDDVTRQGFLFTVLPDSELIFLAWFTFDTERPPESVAAILGDPGHRWLTALGPFDGNRAILDIEHTTGGIFDSNEVIPDQEYEGTIELVFDDCRSGTFTYNIPSIGRSRTIGITRAVDENVASCEQMIQAASD